MVMFSMRTAWRASAGMLKSPLTYPKTSPSAPAFLGLPSSTILIPKRSFFVLPMGMDVGLVGVAAYFLTRCRKPDLRNVLSIFGPFPGSKECDLYRNSMVSSIAHRGAGLDAPENTMEALKYCIEQECKFVELDVRTSMDGKLVLLHDQGLERLSDDTNVTNIRTVEWESIKNVDVGAKHPNRQKFDKVNLCLLDDALDYLLEKKAKMILDVKGEDKQVIEGILRAFSSRPQLYDCAAITCFNPYVLYQIRKNDPEIVGALSYRPYCFSAHNYDAESGPTDPRCGDNVPLHVSLRVADFLYAKMWRWCARWCAVSAVLLHKDIVSPAEAQFWRNLDIRCVGWCINSPVEKMYWKSVLKAPYLTKTLVGEPEEESSKHKQAEEEPANIIDSIIRDRAAGPN